MKIGEVGSVNRRADELEYYYVNGKQFAPGRTP